MKKHLLATALLSLPASIFAQSAMEAYQFSQSDIKGTARFMSMGGAFGALGGDLSTLSQNPAGIGVYRQSDIGFTLNLDNQRSTAANTGAGSVTDTQTKFLLNNIGAVGTIRLGSSALRNINFGFTYNKDASFNRRYSGQIGQLRSSMSNYIAGISNDYGVTEGDVVSETAFDPYNPIGINGAPWISILGYDAYLTNPENLGEYETHWTGQWGANTSGSGFFTVEELGSVDSYNLAIGGNINDIVFWGMDFGIINFNYTMRSIWGEKLNNAYVSDLAGAVNPCTANWDMFNYYNVNGTGFNYKLGVIVKPIQELRLGFAFHTPTWYSMNESYYADVTYDYDNDIRKGTAMTNDGYDGTNTWNFRSPWRLIASAAGVIGSKMIVSADYEWRGYRGMHYSSGVNYGFGFNQGYNDPYYETNNDIGNYFQSSNQIRLGVEYRVLPNFSVRAGYSFVSSPFKTSVKDDSQIVYTNGTRLSYSVDDNTNYVSAGLGYRVNHFYIDLAYMYKQRSSTFHAYSPDPAYPGVAPQAGVKSMNHQIVLTAGFKF